jgi:hypothetical protein
MRVPRAFFSDAIERPHIMRLRTEQANAGSLSYSPASAADYLIGILHFY